MHPPSIDNRSELELRDVLPPLREVFAGGILRVVDHDREEGRDVLSVAAELAEFPLGWRLGMPFDLSSQRAEMFGLRPVLVLDRRDELCEGRADGIRVLHPRKVLSSRNCTMQYVAAVEAWVVPHGLVDDAVVGSAEHESR